MDIIPDFLQRPIVRPASSQSSFDNEPVAGPSNGHYIANGHTETNGFRVSIRRVEPPGRGMYAGSSVDREEFVRLVLQGLRDVGYVEAAATLEAESGYTLESSSVADFRECVLNGQWGRVESSLTSLGVVMEEDLRVSPAYVRFLVCEQKFLEYLENRQLDVALEVLREEITPLQQEPQRTYALSGLMMCDPKDLHTRAQWDGAAGRSREVLLNRLQRYIPSSIMIPPRRLETLLNQARQLQSNACIYHTSTRPFSLYIDHQCDRTEFPLHTTMILADHQDEIWHLAWSNDGTRLATASRDQSVIIWRIGVSADPNDCALEQRLREHANAVSFVAWSPDNNVLLTAAEATIKMWNPKTGLCIKSILGHEDTVCSLVWRRDGSGFISGGMDQKILFWDKDGKQLDSLEQIPIRMSSVAISPDERWLVVAGMLANPTKTLVRAENGNGAQNPALTGKQTRFTVYDLRTKEEHASIDMTGEITSVTISSDSNFGLINHSPDGVMLWSLEEPKLVRKYAGQKQTKHVIRSCFGGPGENFVLSGSEDTNVYVWHKESGTPLEILQGHGQGSVNAVAWNPCQEAMFATCSDDHTVRIWGKDPPGFITSITESTTEDIPPQVSTLSRDPPTLRWDDAREMFL
ncbi:WD40 repeat-like protein [Dacryopinax primogenitus]|uniref:WD40 repeat-like protein n=1 Tax=Dacryopinax primogenitus (strain DJM 731) TaxID=1858805 RepID=M5GEM8_DACPD|nr:WD40 repeat-like protein [Dacryopinax primogenitus]EJU05547.1 WD40 repeat-like protein [Dacryopinax primogenitus]